MKLITRDIQKRLIRNGALRQLMQDAGHAESDFLPVVKLFTPDAGCTWLLTELDPDDHDRAFGLCDLGMDFPELGYVSRSELERLRGPLGLPVERDLHFCASRTISDYAAEARRLGGIRA
jgi:hypothetical protein